MRAIVLENTPILIPNKEHKNFTDSGQTINKDSIVDGNVKVIAGLRKGVPFNYRLFVTDKNEIIHLNKIKPMNKTEVYLGADAGATPTVVKMPNESNLGMRPVVGTFLGALIGFYYAKTKMPTKTMMAAVIGGVAGFAVGKYLQGNGIVLFKKSK